ncbi:MAG: type II toxin-antitoxin system HipA family toxin [Lachnospiraceae bacterium]|nr:type II toxin-antitoxin system HipA family toxin [Lachnospiraceae bacterium]
MREFRVHAGWTDPVRLIGICNIENAHGREVISFSYDREWLREHSGFILDPDIFAMEGRQYPSMNKPCFGFLADIAPDRWGRTLMDRREAAQAKEQGRAPRTLLESDYILGVHDGGRIGGIRLYDETEQHYLSEHDTLAALPMEKLRDLEYAAMKLEAGDSNAKWLNNLLDPGSSLGGARPKANVLDEEGNLWIAKFPSGHDVMNAGAWEMVAHELAEKCNLYVPDAKTMRLSDRGDTFLSRRFDRIGRKRVHYASAMTMLGQTDGSEDKISYLDLAGAIEEFSAEPVKDLYEMWRRLVFNICISNTDDHLRNHGFLLGKNGWRLSPGFDINPAPDSFRMSLNIADNDEKDIKTAFEISDYFRIDKDDAREEILNIQNTIHDNWQGIADKYHISKREQGRMKNAFEQAERDIF